LGCEVGESVQAVDYDEGRVLIYAVCDSRASEFHVHRQRWTTICWLCGLDLLASNMVCTLHM